AWAGFELFDAHLADSELPEALRVLRHLRRYRRNEFTRARSCQLYARRGKRGPALRMLQRLCLSDHPGSWPLDGAEHACLKAGWRSAVDQLSAAVLEQPRCRPQAAVLWASTLEAGPRFEAARSVLPRIVELLDREIEARPAPFQPHEAKALVLGLAGRFP